MVEYESVVYLDVQKTGSTFIEKFLQEHMTEKLVRIVKHGWISDYTSDKYYFISSRGPLDQYFSLFNFGCDHCGGLYERLAANGYGYLYERSVSGFEAWLDFMLAPKNAAVIRAKGYDRVANTIFGLVTFRFLALALPSGPKQLVDVKTRKDVVSVYRSKTRISATVRTEQLNADLAELVRGPLSSKIRSVESALSALRQVKKVNASNRKEEIEYGFSKELIDRMQDREWFCYDIQGYSRAKEQLLKL